MAFDFDAAVTAPFRMQPGLRRLPVGALQLTPTHRDSRHFREKLPALLEHPWRVLLRNDTFDAEAALAVLALQAAHEHPRSFGWDGVTATSHALGWAVSGERVHEVDAAKPVAAVGQCLRALPPRWRLAALLSLALAEDFAVLDTATTVVPWLAVSLPSHWDPRHKLDLDFVRLHGPVADNQRLLSAAQALCRLVGGPHRWERFVWSITPQASLNAHPQAVGAADWGDGDARTIAGAAHWRTERQTFIPVPGRPQALFTILVDSEPLTQAIDSAAKAARVHAALASMSDAVLRYRRLHTVRAPLLQWLAARAGQ